MTFRPYTKEDKLEVGTKIRLGGREGEITFITEPDDKGVFYAVDWNANEGNLLYLENFTFEIEDAPLKIDKRAKKEILSILSYCHGAPGGNIERLTYYLNSLEEV